MPIQPLSRVTRSLKNRNSGWRSQEGFLKLSVKVTDYCRGTEGASQQEDRYEEFQADIKDGSIPTKSAHLPTDVPCTVKVEKAIH